LKSFSFVPLLDYIKNYKDQKWLDLNKNLDNLHLKDLKIMMLKKLEET
jgi:hypothetical protein